MFLPITRSNFRPNLITFSGRGASQVKGLDAHHVFPVKFADKFAKKGVRIHDPKYGSWWELHDHRSKSRAYNRAWELFLKDDPTPKEIINFGRKMAKHQGLVAYF